MRSMWVAALAMGTAFAQNGTDWMTSAFDAQRSNWVRGDRKISPESMRKPGFEQVWKMKFDNTPRGSNAITAPALIDFYISYRGFRTLGFFGGSSDRIFAVDTDLARSEWDKVFSTNAPAGSGPCPGGMTSAVTRPTGTAYPQVPTGRGTGRGTPAKSAVGEPFAGAVTLNRVRSAPPPPPKPVAASKPAPVVPSPFAPRIQWLLALAADGKLHSLYISNGNEPKPGVPFVPANANAAGLIAYDGTAYVSTIGGCSGVPDGVWAIDLESGSVTSWKAPGKVAGSAGHAAGPDGTIYVAAGSEIAALEPKTLKLKGTGNAGVALNSSPVVFEFKEKDLIAVAGGGAIHLFDAANLATPLGKSSAGSQYDAGALASWQDPSGTRWLLAPTSSGIAAFKVVEKNGTPALEPAWTSREIASPLPPIIVSGVVFAASRAKPSVLYALDSATGKELWNSGSAIAGTVTGALAAGGSRVYVSTVDGTQYAFGFPIEH